MQGTKSNDYEKRGPSLITRNNYRRGGAKKKKNLVFGGVVGAQFADLLLLKGLPVL